MGRVSVNGVQILSHKAFETPPPTEPGADKPEAWSGPPEHSSEDHPFARIQQVGGQGCLLDTPLPRTGPSLLLVENYRDQPHAAISLTVAIRLAPDGISFNPYENLRQKVEWPHAAQGSRGTEGPGDLPHQRPWLAHHSEAGRA